MDWKSMETAPKDGTKVLVGWPGIINMGRYDSYNALWFCSGSGKHFLPEQPTHWMPLPDPPAVENPQSNGTEDRCEAIAEKLSIRILVACGNSIYDDAPLVTLFESTIQGWAKEVEAMESLAPQVAEKVSMAELSENFIKRPGYIDCAWVSAGIRAILERVGAADRIQD